MLHGGIAASITTNPARQAVEPLVGIEPPKCFTRALSSQMTTRGKVDPELRLELRLTDSKTVVLPLDDPGKGDQMTQYKVLVRRVIDGSIDIDANSVEEARLEAESMLGRGSSEIEWCDPEDDVMSLEYDV